MNENLSAVNSSVVPSDLISAYLSSSNGKKVSFAPAVTTAESLLVAILTVNVFLITILEEVKSTSEINCFGIVVYNAFALRSSADVDNFVPTIFKSLIVLAVGGRSPSKTPVTVVTPVTVTSPALTLVTLAPIGVAESVVVNFKILPTFTFDKKLEAAGAVILGEPAPSVAVIEETPTFTKVSSTVSAVNVTAAPMPPGKLGPP